MNIHISGKLITRDDYAFELMLVGGLLGAATIISSYALLNGHIVLGLVFLISMGFIAMLMIWLLKMQQQLIYKAALEHELIELTNMKNKKY